MSQGSQRNAAPILAIDFLANPLIPAVITDATSGEVLMVGFMNEEAYLATRETARTHFWSRSRNRLWKKGETSAHEQIVERVSVNCELNTLLIAVTQIGAVCHDGYPSCFYRDIEDDESLTITMDRWFDPAIVYGGQTDPVRLWYDAYSYLKNAPLDDVSSTSRSLRTGGIDFTSRVADELEELGGVLDGSHHHDSRDDDLLLEGSQALYWLALVAIASDIAWNDLRPDRALDTANPGFSVETAARLLRSEAATWRQAAGRTTAEQVHAAMSIVAQAMRAGGITPLSLIEQDLGELRAKPYMDAYFSS